MKKTIKSLFLQIFQLVALIGFLGILYFQEMSILKIIEKGANEDAVNTMHSFLFGLQPHVFHFSGWILMWPLFLVSISLILFKKWRFYFLALSGLTTSILLMADKHYYQVFSCLINVSTYKAIPLLWNIRASISQIISYKDLLYVSSFLLFIAVGMVLNRYKPSDFKMDRLNFLLDKIIGVCFFIFFIEAFNVGFYFDKRNVVQRVSGDQSQLIVSDQKIEKNPKYKYFTPYYETSAVDFAASFGVLNYHARDIILSIFKQHKASRISPKQLMTLSKWLTHKQELNQTKSPFWGCAKNRNVFILSLESFSPLAIGLRVNDITVTPNLNKITQNALIWDYMIDQTQGGGTSDAEFSLFTGLIPSNTQISSIYIPTSNPLVTLPKILKQNGYETMSMHGYFAYFWNRSINHPIYGIDKMFFKDRYTTNSSYGLKDSIADAVFFNQSVDYLKKEKQPFMDYLITASSHHPYELVPEGYRNLFSPALQDNSELAGYLKLIKYTDAALKDFFEKLKENGMWNNSIFIMFGDHKPPLSNESKDQFGKLADTQFTSYRQSRVFFTILIPGKEDLIARYKEQYRSVVGDLHDVFPTILHLLGQNPPFGISGTHLFVPNKERDPMPFQKAFTRLFIYNGVLYLASELKAMEDNKGIIYTNNFSDVIKDKFAIQDKFLNAVQEIVNHQKLIDYDAQEKIIALQSRK